MQGKQIQERLSGIVHAETQRKEAAFDLTVSTINSIEEAGRLDFGGGEHVDAKRIPVETTKRDPDDDYGWWHLDEGTYIVTFNETLRLDDGDGPLLLQPRRVLARQGIHHPTLLVDEVPEIPISVPASGALIKENARISTLASP